MSCWSGIRLLPGKLVGVTPAPLRSRDPETRALMLVSELEPLSPRLDPGLPFHAESLALDHGEGSNLVASLRVTCVTPTCPVE